jgi:peptidoglycan-N-acetylglucosamine deacetylase
VIPGAVAHGPRDVPAVALTFDDGPGAVTMALLDVLAAHGARATFDVLGERIAGRERIVRRTVSEGHEIGVHGWRHGDHRRRPWAGARGAAAAARLVAATCGARARVFRPPFGLTSRRLEVAVAAHGLRTVLWDVDPRDFEEPGADAVARRTLVAVRPGSIVLLHDDRPELAPTADAVDAILAALTGRGLRAVTVSELLRPVSDRWTRSACSPGCRRPTRRPSPSRPSRTPARPAR